MKLNAQKEIKPLFNYIIVRPFDVNPYKTRITNSGIVLQAGASAYSQETGQQESLDQRIQYGIVMEIGDGVKTVQVGDEIYYDKLTAMPLPILDLGFQRVNEQNVISFVRGEGDAIADAIAFEEQLIKDLDESERASKLSKAGIIL